MSEPAETAAGAFRFRHTVEVRFRDLDPMGHAHHTLPLIYFEDARAAYWREVAGRADVEAIDYIMGEFHVRYHARIRYPGRLDVGVRVERLGTSSFTMVYELRDDHGILLATGRSEQVMFDYAHDASMAIPAPVRERIEAYERL